MRINVVQMGKISDASEAWRLSRNVLGHTDWQEIFTIDCPVTEFPQAFLHFEDFTLLEREIFASNRAHVMWARTSFVDDPIQFKMPAEVELDATFDGLQRAQMMKEKEAGLHSDQWRQHLPLLSLTSFSMRVSFRDIIKYAKYFDLLATQSAVLGQRFYNVRQELRRVATHFVGSPDLVDKAEAAYSLARFLCHDPVSHEFKRTDLRNLTVLNLEVPFWIRAHFARHRPITFVDDLHRILVNQNVVRATINAPVGMEIAATRDVWKALLSKRSCWMTQSTLSGRQDPWQAIIEAFGVDEQMLPCSAGSCPFRRDAELRLTDEDPGCPCPMHMKLYGVDPEPWRAELAQAYPSRPAFWRSVI